MMVEAGLCIQVVSTTAGPYFNGPAFTYAAVFSTLQ